MTQMFGKHALELIQEVEKCPAENLPSFNDDLFRSVLDEITYLHERLTNVFNESKHRYEQQQQQQQQQQRDQGLLEDTNTNNPSTSDTTWRGTESEAAELMVCHTSILRNKRLLFAYTKQRLDKLQELRWNHRTLPDHISTSLSPLESTFFKGYDKLLTRYMRTGRQGVGLDLTADPTPPDDPYVQVRVLKDFGDVVFSSGKVSLARGKSHWLPRDEAHPLVMDGVLELCGTES